MPAFVKTKEDERIWGLAKEAARKFAKRRGIEVGSDRFWKLVTGLFKKFRGQKNEATDLDVCVVAVELGEDLGVVLVDYLEG